MLSLYSGEATLVACGDAGEGEGENTLVQKKLERKRHEEKDSTTAQCIVLCLIVIRHIMLSDYVVPGSNFTRHREATN